MQVVSSDGISGEARGTFETCVAIIVISALGAGEAWISYVTLWGEWREGGREGGRESDTVWFYCLVYTM